MKRSTFFRNLKLHLGATCTHSSRRAGAEKQKVVTKSGHQKWSPKVVTKSGHHQKWSPPKVVTTKSGHQIRNWSPDQKMNTDQKNIQI